MDKPKTFDEVFKDAYDYWIDDANIHCYEGAKGLADQVWQHQQAKVEELQEEFGEDERFLKEQIKDKDLKIANLEYLQGMDKELIQTLQGRSSALQDKVNELQKRVDALTLALDQIAYPIPHMQKEAEINGCELNGYWAVKMSEDHTYSKDIARRALEKEQALKGEAK